MHPAPKSTNATDTSFPDFYTTMYNLLVLITTANHPDVIIKFYNQNRATAIFPIVFLGVGLYVFMNILTAVVYSEFRGYMLSSVQARLTRRRLATRAAFEILVLMETRPDTVSSDHLIHLIESVNIATWKKEALREAYVSDYAESDLNAAQFMALFRTLDLSSPRYTEHGPRPISSRSGRFLQNWITSSAFYKLSIAVSLLNIINVAIDISDRLTSDTISVQMRVVNWCFVTFYLFEQCGLLWAFGVRRFFSKFSNVFGLVVVLLLLVMKIIELGFLIAAKSGFPFHFVSFTLWDVVNLTNILLITRAVRVVNLFVWTHLVASVLKDLPRNLAPVLGILASAYYVYALLGMNLFRGVITHNSNSTIRVDYPCGTYQQLQYWSVNFDDFASSLVLLWDLMVVNNWYVIVNAYQQAVSNWVHLYMVSWWLIAPVGLLSLVTAFVIESFLHRRDLYTKVLARVEQPKEVVFVGGSSTVVPVATSNFDAPVQTTHGDALSLQPNFWRTLNCTETSVWQRNAHVSMINTSSLDEIFRSALKEPSEDELLSQLSQHKQLERLRYRAQTTRVDLDGTGVHCSFE